MIVKTGNATTKNYKELSLGRSIWDPYDQKPRHEQILEQAHKYMEDHYHRTLEELFSHNTLGTTLLKEINELLTSIIERHKASIVSGKNMPSLQESTSGVNKEKQQIIFQKELKSGQHHMKNLEAELEEVDRIIESVKDPL